VTGGGDVFTGAIEDALLGHAAVDDAAVIARRDGAPGLVAHVVVGRAGVVDAAELRAHVTALLGPAAAVDDVRFVASIPLDETGQPLVAGH
jgi:acyl-coenzyme A synthetase/AMP-(fatty) acid ligase